MGITIMGDVIAVLKHAKKVYSEVRLHVVVYIIIIQWSRNRGGHGPPNFETEGCAPPPKCHYEIFLAAVNAS